MSSNANPEYLEFWPVVAKAWLDFGITPVLFYIPYHAEDTPTSQVTPAEVPGSKVHVVPHLPDINIVLQSSMLRFWGTCYYPDDIVIISDIDLLPLSRRFFTDPLADVADDRYVHLKYARDGYMRGGYTRSTLYIAPNGAWDKAINNALLICLLSRSQRSIDVRSVMAF